MTLSPAAFFGDLDETNPQGGDSRTISDNQHRNIINSCKSQGPNWTGAITSTHEDLNLLDGYVAGSLKPVPGVGGETVHWFYGPLPAGYTVEQPDTNLRNLAIADTGAGSIAGDIDPSAATLDTTVINVSVDLPSDTGGHALTEAENGPHTHGQTGKIQDGVSAFPRSGNAGTTSQALNIDSSGSGTPHTHPIGGTAAQTSGSGTGSTTEFNPRRAIGQLGKLDA